MVSQLKLVYKLVGASWVRIASSVQSRFDGPLLHNAPPAETARWKRCVPRFPPITVLIAKGCYQSRRLEPVRANHVNFAAITLPAVDLLVEDPAGKKPVALLGATRFFFHRPLPPAPAKKVKNPIPS